MKLLTALSRNAKAFLTFLYKHAWMFIYLFAIGFILSLVLLIYNFNLNILIQHLNLTKVPFSQTGQPILIEHSTYVLVDGNPAELTFYWYWDTRPSAPLSFTLIIPGNLRPLGDVTLKTPDTIQVDMVPDPQKSSPVIYKLPLIQRNNETGSIFQLSQPQTVEIKEAGKKAGEVSLLVETQWGAALRKATQSEFGQLSTPITLIITAIVSAITALYNHQTSQSKMEEDRRKEEAANIQAKQLEEKEQKEIEARAQEAQHRKEFGEQQAQLFRLIEQQNVTAAAEKLTYIRSTYPEYIKPETGNRIAQDAEHLILLMQGRLDPKIQLIELVQSHPNETANAMVYAIQNFSYLGDSLQPHVLKMNLAVFPQEIRCSLEEVCTQIIKYSTQPARWPVRPPIWKMGKMINADNFRQYVFGQERAEHPDENEALFNETSGLFWGDHPLYVQLQNQRGTHLVRGEPGSGKTAFARALGDYMLERDVFAASLFGWPDEKRVNRVLAERLLEFVCENPYRMNMSRAERFLLAEVLSSRLDWRVALARMEMALREKEDPPRGNTGPLKTALPEPGERQFAVFFKQALEDVGSKPRRFKEGHWLQACLETLKALRFSQTRLVFDLHFPGSEKWLDDHLTQIRVWSEYGIDLLIFLPSQPNGAPGKIVPDAFPVSFLKWDRTLTVDPLRDLVAWRYRQIAMLPTNGIVSQDIQDDAAVMQHLNIWLDDPERSPRQVGSCWQQVFNGSIMT